MANELSVYKYSSYKEYVEEQTKANKQKIDWQFSGHKQIKWIKKQINSASNIICHGTRSGGEQKVFQKLYPNAYIIGTEISDTATQFEMTVCHDFSLQRDDWIERFDILYSNAFDHSYDPNRTIVTWKNQLTEEGRMFIHWGKYHQHASHGPRDPVSGSIDNFKKFLNRHGLEVLSINNDVLMCKNISS